MGGQVALNRKNKALNPQKINKLDFILADRQLTAILTLEKRKLPFSRRFSLY